MTRNNFPSGPRGNAFISPMVASSRRDPLNFLTMVAREYGDVSSFRIGLERVFFLNHPDYIKSVLLNHYEFFLKGSGSPRMKQFLGEGVLLSEGTRHKDQRKMLQTSFHRERLASYAKVITDYGKRLSERWHDQDVIDLTAEMRRLTLGIVGRALFNADVESKADEVGQAMLTATIPYRAFKLPLARLLEKLPLSHIREFQRGKKRLQQVVYRLIEERRRTGKDYGDILSTLVSAQRDQNKVLSDQEVWDQALTVFVAGYDTLTLALTWTWYLLSQHPEIEAKLHAEVDQVLGGSREPNFEDLPRLQYATMVLSEAMRLYPPVWRLVRRTIKDFPVGQHTIPAGSLVVVSQWVMHRDPRFFPDPLRFDPERWTVAAKAERPTYCYFPFGGGPRKCLGDGLAWMEGTLLIAAIASRWRLRLEPGQSVELQPTHMLRSKHDLLVKLERRAVAKQDVQVTTNERIVQCPFSGMPATAAVGR